MVRPQQEPIFFGINSLYQFVSYFIVSMTKSLIKMSWRRKGVCCLMVGDYNASLNGVMAAGT